MLHISKARSLGIVAGLRSEIKQASPVMSPEQHWKLAKHYINRYRMNLFRDVRDYHEMFHKAYLHFVASNRPYMPRCEKVVQS